MNTVPCAIRSWRTVCGRVHKVLQRCYHNAPPEIQQIQEVCRRFAQEKLQPIAGRLDAEGEYPAGPIEELAKLGLLSITVPKEDGGSGMNTLALSVAVEELSAGCASTGAIVSIYNCLYTNLLARYATNTQKEKFLYPYTTSGVLGCFALSEPEAGSDVAALQTTATECQDGYVLNGTKSWVTSGTVGDIAVIFATIDKSLHYKGITAFLVPLTAEGVTRGKADDKLGIRAAPSCNITLDNVLVPKENILGEIGEGFKIAMIQLELARIGIASQALGISQAALTAAVEYSFQRVAFKQHLNEFQAVKLRIADMALQLEAARLLVHRAATRYDMVGRASKECSMAKTAASTGATAITHSALQILGGMGYVKHMSVERHFRDARVTEIYGGVTDIQKLIIAECILQEHQRRST